MSNRVFVLDLLSVPVLLLTKIPDGRDYMRTFITVICCFISLSLLSCAPSEKGLDNGEFTAVLNGVDIFYAIHGHGPVCFALPNSWGICHHALRVLYRPLEEHVTMVYFDPRGMGQSADIQDDADMSMGTIRKDLEALRVHLGLESVNIIGWSNGGMNLLLFAVEYPETIEAAIVVHSIAHFGDEDMKLFTEQHPELYKQYGVFMTIMASDSLSNEEKETMYRDFACTVSFHSMLADREKDMGMLDEFFRGNALSWKHYKYSNEIDSPAFDARDYLSRITAPTLVIAGAKDLIPQSKAKEISDGIENATFVLFENSGHFAPFEEKEKFVDTVVTFIQGSKKQAVPQH